MRIPFRPECLSALILLLSSFLTPITAALLSSIATPITTNTTTTKPANQSLLKRNPPISLQNLYLAHAANFTTTTVSHTPDTAATFLSTLYAEIHAQCIITSYYPLPNNNSNLLPPSSPPHPTLVFRRAGVELSVVVIKGASTAEEEKEGREKGQQEGVGWEFVRDLSVLMWRLRGRGYEGFYVFGWCDGRGKVGVYVGLRVG